MKYLKIVLPAILLALSTSVNAVVVNTLNGQQYEWLELTATRGLSRDSVETMLTDVNSSLYGYQYASRSLVEDLFLSYASWDGINGLHGNSDVVSGVSNLISDFGATYTIDYGTTYSVNTVDVGLAYYTGYSVLDGYMGTSSECGTNSCRAFVNLYNNNGISTMTSQSRHFGWDSNYGAPLSLPTNFTDYSRGSYLVRPSVVPVPAAAWLFGSALLGFFGFSRRKDNA